MVCAISTIIFSASSGYLPACLLYTSKLQDLHADEYWQVKEHLDRMNSEIAGNNITLSKQHDDLSTLSEQSQKLEKQVTSQRNKIARSKELYQSIEYALDTFLVSDVSYNNCRLNPHDKEDLEELVPSVILKLHCMDVKDLRKAYRENAKQIDRLMDLYEARYTTKVLTGMLVAVAFLGDTVRCVVASLLHFFAQVFVVHLMTILPLHVLTARRGNLHRSTRRF